MWCIFLQEVVDGGRFKAMDCYTGEIVAMKKVRVEDSSDGIPSTSLREISVLRSLDHPNIVKLVHFQFVSHRLTDVENSDGRIHLVFECIDKTLTACIVEHQKTGGLPIEEVKVGLSESADVVLCLPAAARP